MSQAQREEKFNVAASLWKGAKAELDRRAEAYRVQYANVYLSASGADALRKAAADAATSALRTERDYCEREERFAYHTMILHRGSAGEAERAS